MFAIPLLILLSLYTVVMFILLSIAWVCTVWWDGKGLLVHAVSRIWARGYFVLVPGWSLRVEGAIERSETFVVVANHRSMFDIVTMYLLPLRNFKWVSKREVYNWPVFGWVLWMHRDITVRRGSVAGLRKMVKEGKYWLDRGVSVAVFPEGTRSGGRFHEGAFMLAREAGVRVVPVVLGGTEGFRKGRNLFSVRILPPMEPDMEAVREAMARTGA